MNAYCGTRFFRPARLFSLDLLDGPQVRLRRPRLREAHGRVRLGAWGWAGGIEGFGLDCLATAFMSHPG